MKKNARCYRCKWCHRDVTICRQCDRGNSYCSPCARKARAEAQRQASRNYQETHQGKLNHAKRQKNYRERQKSKNPRVTQQGYKTTEDVTCLTSLEQAIGIKRENNEDESKIARCHFCHRDVSLTVQGDFTRECVQKLIRGMILPRIA